MTSEPKGGASTPALPDRLYHYTTVAGALGIISSKGIWISSAVNMNDRAEGLVLEQVLTRYMRDRDATLTDTERLRWKTVYQGIFLAEPMPYIACFSANRDQLSQWRGYADDGFGMCIGFDRSKLPATNDPAFLSKGEPGRECVLQEVKYFHDAMGRVFTNGLENALALKFAPTAVEDNMAVLSAWRWILKNPAFSEEREYRIINRPVPTGRGSRATGAVGDRRFREAGRRLVSYYELGFPVDAIVEITLGPQSRVDRREVFELLADRGYPDIPVVESEATYRS